MGSNPTSSFGASSTITTSTMQIFLDTADINDIRERWDTGIITGVTTNPTLVRKAGGNYVNLATTILDEFPEIESLSLELSGETYDDFMRGMGDFYLGHPAVTLKVPCTRDGLKFVNHCADNGVPTNVTLCFSAAQAVMAGLSGATYVSPFVGRMNDNSLSGVELVRAISGLYKQHGVATKVLAASLRDAHHVSRCLLYGADVVTLPPSTFDKMYHHVLTDVGLDIFAKDFEAIK